MLVILKWACRLNSCHMYVPAQTYSSVTASLQSFVLLYIASRCSGGKQGVVGESGGRLSQEDASEEEEEGEVVSTLAHRMF